MEIIQVILFVIIIVVAIVQQTSKSNKKKRSNIPDKELTDEFPEVEVVGEWPIYKTIKVSKSEPTRRKQSQFPRKQKKKPTTTSIQNVASSPVNKEANTSSIRLNTKEEARRAFIYSEIFNSKYQ